MIVSLIRGRSNVGHKNVFIGSLSFDKTEPQTRLVLAHFNYSPLYDIMVWFKGMCLRGRVVSLADTFWWFLELDYIWYAAKFYSFSLCIC